LTAETSSNIAADVMINNQPRALRRFQNPKRNPRRRRRKRRRRRRRETGSLPSLLDGSSFLLPTHVVMRFSSIA